MITPPKLSFACPMPWTTMTGSERWKYCTLCGHHVTNLSLLSAAERAALVERAKTERICGTYYLRLSGEMVTPDAPLTSRERQGIKQVGVALLSAAAMAIASGCVSTAAPKNILAPPQVATATIEKSEPEAAPVCPSSPKATDRKDDEQIVLMVGMMDFTLTPTHQPGRSGK